MATGLQSMTEFVDLLKTGRAPTTWPDAVRGTKDPDALARSVQDPSLRRVAGRVTGVTGLQPNEFLAVELVENPRGSGLILHTEIGPDGSFEFRNVQPRMYQAIVLRTCRNCQYLMGMGAPVAVVVGDNDITNLQTRQNTSKKPLEPIPAFQPRTLIASNSPASRAKSS